MRNLSASVIGQRLQYGVSGGSTRNGKTNRNSEFTRPRFTLQIVYAYSCDSESKAQPVLTAIVLTAIVDG